MARVLLVDDEPTILVVMGAVFRCAGYEVVTAEGGCEAVEPLRKEHFDLLITDVRMSPLDGISLLEMVKKEHPDMPVILVTAFQDFAAQQRAMKLGAYAYFTKPFDNVKLLAAVAAALGAKGQSGDSGKKS